MITNRSSTYGAPYQSYNSYTELYYDMLAIYEMTIVSLETNTFAVFMILRIHFKNENNNEKSELEQKVDLIVSKQLQCFLQEFILETGDEQ